MRLGADARHLEGAVVSRPPLLVTLLLALLLGAVAILLCVAVVLVIWVSLALSGLFTLLPAALLHALLR